MKTAGPSLFSSLLMGATQGMRDFLTPRITALHGARANVLTVRQIPAEPAQAEEQCYLLEALIEPASDDQAWSPGELALSSGEAAAHCRVLDARVIEKRRFIPAAGLTCRGARRVRLRVAVSRAHAAIYFQHRDAFFGQVCLAPEALTGV